MSTGPKFAIPQKSLQETTKTVEVFLLTERHLLQETTFYWLLSVEAIVILHFCEPSVRRLHLGKRKREETEPAHGRVGEYFLQ